MSHCEFACVDFIRKKIANETTGNIAAIVVEPIQGTAGNVVPPPDFLKKLRALADEIGALLIADEMICGFGALEKCSDASTSMSNRILSRSEKDSAGASR